MSPYVETDFRRGEKCNFALDNKISTNACFLWKKCLKLNALQQHDMGNF
jgi:hypothetical protein